MAEQDILICWSARAFMLKVHCLSGPAVSPAKGWMVPLGADDSAWRQTENRKCGIELLKIAYGQQINIFFVFFNFSMC